MPDTKAYYNTTAIKRVWYCFKIRQMRQNRELRDIYTLKQRIKDDGLIDGFEKTRSICGEK